MDWIEKIKKWKEFNEIIFFWGVSSKLESLPGLCFFTFMFIFAISQAMSYDIKKRFKEKIEVVKINPNSIPNFNVKTMDEKLVLSSLENQQKINKEMIEKINSQQKINEDMLDKINKQQKEINSIIVNFKDK